MSIGLLFQTNVLKSISPVVIHPIEATHLNLFSVPAEGLARQACGSHPV